MICSSPSFLVSPAGLGSVLTRLQLGIRATRHGLPLVARRSGTRWYVNSGGPSYTFGCPGLLSSSGTSSSYSTMGFEEGGERRKKNEEEKEEKGKEEERARVVSSISPSSVACFKQCPQLFYYRFEHRD